jgi:F-type H+-transporting ATPase subunit a
MHLSPDAIIFWQHGFLKLNATIVFTWGLMLVLAVGSKLITRRLSTGLNRSRWQNLLEIVVTLTEKQIEEVGLRHPKKYLPFLGTLFLFVALAALCTVFPGYEPPTGSLSTTAALALCVFVAVPLFGIVERGWGGYLKSYVQPTFIMLPFNHAGPGRPPVRQHDERDDDHRYSADHHAVYLSDRDEGARPAHRHGASLHLLYSGHGLHRGRYSRA